MIDFLYFISHESRIEFEFINDINIVTLAQIVTNVYKSCKINKFIFLLKMGSLQMGHHILSNNHDFVSSSSGYLSPFTS